MKILFVLFVLTLPLAAQSYFEKKFMEYGILQYPSVKKRTKQKTGSGTGNLSWLDQAGKESNNLFLTPIQNEVLSLTVKNTMVKKTKLRFDARCSDCEGIRLYYPRRPFVIKAGSQHSVPVQFRFHKGRQKTYRVEFFLLDQKGDIISTVQATVRPI